MKLTRLEQETVIRGNAAEDEWEVVTADPAMINLMKRKGWEEDERENPWGYKSYVVPGWSVLVKQRERKGRKLSEAHKEALRKGRLASRGILGEEN